MIYHVAHPYLPKLKRQARHLSNPVTPQPNLTALDTTKFEGREGKDGEGKGVQMKAFKMYQKLGQMKKRSRGEKGEKEKDTKEEGSRVRVREREKRGRREREVPGSASSKFSLL